MNLFGTYTQAGYFFLCIINVYASIGSFWHISDLHIDQNYSRTGNPNDLCHSADKEYPDNGQYGNVLCDSPLILIDKTIESMHFIQSEPDFILWTGDNLPHTNKVFADWELIFEALKNTTKLLKSTFLNVPIIPCIGNHDTFPPNLLLNSSVYKGYLETGGWNEILPESTWGTFMKGGYFSYSLFKGLRVISLNNILWYISNDYTKDMTDPGDQLQWLESCLKNCSTNSEKVYIVGHVPPGFYNKVAPEQESVETYHIQYLNSYIDILSKYGDIIQGQMYGHIHLDYFQVFQYNSGTFKGSSLIASSVTPWHSLNQGNLSLPVNPSVRLLQYSQEDYTLLDYHQYFLNLSDANNNPSFKEGSRYQLLYQFRPTYRLPDLSTHSLSQLFEDLKCNATTYEAFDYYLSAGTNTTACDAFCRLTQLCAMSTISKAEYDACRRTVHQDHPLLVEENGAGQSYAVLYGIVCLFVVVIALGVYVACKRKGGVVVHRRRYTDFSDF